VSRSRLVPFAFPLLIIFYAPRASYGVEVFKATRPRGKHGPSRIVRKRTTARFGRCFYERSVMARPFSLGATHIVPVSGAVISEAPVIARANEGAVAGEGGKKVPRNAIDVIHRGYSQRRKNFYVPRVRKEIAPVRAPSPSTPLRQT